MDANEDDGPAAVADGSDDTYVDTTTGDQPAAEAATSNTTDDTTTVSNQKRRNKSYSVSYKLDVVRFAKANSNRLAARKYQIDPKRVREWRQKESDLKEMAVRSKDVKRGKGGGRKPCSVELEEDVLSWIRSMRSRRLRVRRKMVMRRAWTFTMRSIA